MKELMFRAWDTEAKCYIKDPILVDNFGNVYVVCEESSNKKGTCLITGKPNVILEQYTGLKDKNGKEIYEGDIARCSFGESGVVELRHGAYCVVGDDITDMSNWKESAYEIIGNIHEAPELLGGKE